MKLNSDCVRDTLLYLEDILTINFQHKTFNAISGTKLIEDMMSIHTCYDADEIWYVIYNLKQVNFIEGRFSNTGNMKMCICDIENITWAGHQFLDSIRPESIWHIIKTKTSKIGDISISGLSMIANAVIQEIANDPALIKSVIQILIS